ncbi:hypothetical protein ACEPAH_2574 [Sanghuangporus vaninii]
MSSEVSPLEISQFTGLAHEMTAFKSIIVACATFHFYYTALHFDEEVEYIWSKKWTVGKGMYLLTRYLGTFYLICAIMGVHTYAWNDPDDRLDESVNNPFETCLYGNLSTGLGTMIILVAEVILMMRVYALYGRNKGLLIFFTLLTIILLVFNILQLLDIFLSIEQGTCGFGSCLSTPSFDDFHFACMDSAPISGIGWAVTSFVELLLFLLVVLKAGSRERIRSVMRKSNSQPARPLDVTTSMAKDSISYFAMIFTMCLIGATLVFIVEHHSNAVTSFIGTQMNAYETIVITIMTILAPKLVLNLRAAYYGPPEDVTMQLVWNAQMSTSSTTNRGLEDFCVREELESFMD